VPPYPLLKSFKIGSYSHFPSLSSQTREEPLFLGCSSKLSSLFVVSLFLPPYWSQADSRCDLFFLEHMSAFPSWPCSSLPFLPFSLLIRTQDKVLSRLDVRCAKSSSGIPIPMCSSIRTPFFLSYEIPLPLICTYGSFVTFLFFTCWLSGQDDPHSLML